MIPREAGVDPSHDLDGQFLAATFLGLVDLAEARLRTRDDVSSPGCWPDESPTG